MSDRELLELAARAAGINGIYIETACGPCLSIVDACGAWRPLTDDGDALRLAVKLNLLSVMGGVMRAQDASGEYFTDEYTATRRAITRAAAAIGEGMK